jgi:ribonuclease D
MTTSSLSSTDVRVEHGDVTLALFHAARQRGMMAVDTETTGLDPRTSTLCTVQSHVPGWGTEITIVDVAVAPARLLMLVCADDIVKIFHHAMFDLRFIRHTYQSQARAVACTKVAAKLLWPGMKERQSLKGLARYLLGTEMDKSQRLSDWSRATLTDAQLRYAATDAQILPALLEAMTAQLRQRQLLELAEACWRHIPTRVELEERELGDVFTY